MIPDAKVDGRSSLHITLFGLMQYLEKTDLEVPHRMKISTLKTMETVKL
jgi:hypothetical protein